MKGLTVVIILVIIGVGGWFILRDGDPGITGNVVSQEEFLEVSTTIQGFAYNPDTITLKEGSKVKLTVTNKDRVVHAFNLKQFGITGSIQPGAVKTVEFVATKNPSSGQAVYTCSQDHGETLTFIVE